MTCDKTDRNKRDCEWFLAAEIKIKEKEKDEWKKQRMTMTRLKRT